MVRFVSQLFCVICISFEATAASKVLFELSLNAASQHSVRNMSAAARAPVDTEFVSSLKRVLTAGELEHRPLKSDYKPAFFYRHWLHRWDTTATDGVHKFNSYPETEFEKYHFLLSKRLKERASKFIADVQVGFYSSGRDLNLDEIKDVDKRLESRISRDKPFVDGQVINLKGKTTFPVNLFTIGEAGKEYVNFGTPLQNGFYFNNLADYYNAIALLRHWGAYRDLRIISIPANTKVNCRVGLVGPQSFPADNVRYYKNELGNVAAESVEIASLQRLCGNLGLSDKDEFDIMKLVEKRSGGDIQIMFGYVQDYRVYEGEPLCIDVQGKPKEYAKKTPRGWVGSTGTEGLSHFLDKDYFETPFQLENILFEMNIFDREEKEEIVKFLRDKKIRTISTSKSI